MDLKDELESFIWNHRPDFDAMPAPNGLWTKIEAQLPEAPQPRRRWYVSVQRWAAAVALLVVGAAVGFYVKSFQLSTQTEAQMAAALPDFRSTVRFYDAQIEAQKAKLVAYNPDPTVWADLAQIDAVQEELKRALAEAPRAAQESIVRQMIDNYKIKLAILEKVLEHIEAKKLEQQNEKI